MNKERRPFGCFQVIILKDRMDALRMSSLSLLAIASPQPSSRASALKQVGEEASASLLIGQVGARQQQQHQHSLLAQTLDKNRINHSPLASAACGCFVHGCEDEFEVVRIATLDALRTIGLHSAHFTTLAFDLIVDMFNDESTHVRLLATTTLHALAQRHTLHITPVQQGTLLLPLDALDTHIRRTGYAIQRVVRFRTVECVRMLLRALNRNLSRFRNEVPAILHTCAGAGSNSAAFVYDLKDALLQLDRRFLPKEIDMDSLSHIAHIILIFNAGFTNPSILESMPRYAFRQMYFLQSKYPDCFPQPPDSDLPLTVVAVSRAQQVTFLQDAFTAVMRDAVEGLKMQYFQQASAILTRFAREVHQICALEPDLDLARFLKLYTRAMLLVVKIQSDTLTSQSRATALSAAKVCTVARYILVNFSGLDSATRAQLDSLAFFAQVAFAASCPDLCPDATRTHLYQTLLDTHGSTANPVPAILSNYVRSFQLPTLRATPRVCAFRGRVECNVAHGLARGNECVHYVPVPVHVEGDVRGWDGRRACAVVVELSDQRRLVVPIDEAVMQPVGVRAASFEFTAKLVVGASEWMRCRVLQCDTFFQDQVKHDPTWLWKQAVKVGPKNEVLVVEQGEVYYPFGP
ncbi:hypothetical protein BC830DRAFT_1110550 [Chytriomyces sp. MP71]|nr:hypothetical protein BC830DRAFT_1110550 [Chytriomyces sp. MP71]